MRIRFNMGIIPPIPISYLPFVSFSFFRTISGVPSYPERPTEFQGRVYKNSAFPDVPAKLSTFCRYASSAYAWTGSGITLRILSPLQCSHLHSWRPIYPESLYLVSPPAPNPASPTTTTHCAIATRWTPIHRAKWSLPVRLSSRS